MNGIFPARYAMLHNPKTKRPSFLSGVGILTLSSLTVKVIGLFYRIPLLNYLGTEGMGYFNTAYELYALFCVISTAGLPVAMSVLIAAFEAEGNTRDAGRVFRVSLWASKHQTLAPMGSNSLQRPVFFTWQTSCPPPISTWAMNRLGRERKIPEIIESYFMVVTSLSTNRVTEFQKKAR